MFTVNKSPSVGELRTFGWAMLGGFGAIGLFLWVMAWRKQGGDGLLGWSGAGAQVVALCLWALGAGLCALSLLWPRSARPVYVAWMRATVPIGMVMSTILLTVVFVLMLPLFALIVRMGDPLRKKLGGTTYWEDYKPYPHTPDRMRRLF
jgi:hypothetical protein